MRHWRQEWYGAAQSGAAANTMMGGIMDQAQMQQMMGGNVDFDRMFLQMMIPHHQSAITMARQALDQAEHGATKPLAQNIVTTQLAETAEMQGYLDLWYSANASR